MNLVMMRNLILFLLLGSIGCVSGKSCELRVFQLNIWGDATVVPGAFDALTDEIARLDAHIVALCEVNNHHGVTSERLVEALKRRGQTWYGASGRCTGVQGTDVCVLSKYPIEEVVTGLSTVPGGVDMKVRIDVGGRDVLLYPAHLDYTHYACYLPRGYDGVTWKKLPAPDGNPEAVLRMNRASTRDEAVAAFLEEVSRERADLIRWPGISTSRRTWTGPTRRAECGITTVASFPGTARCGSMTPDSATCTGCFIPIRRRIRASPIPPTIRRRRSKN